MTEKSERAPLYQRFRRRQWRWSAVWELWPWVIAALALLAVGWLFVKPAPPKRIVIATGPADGAYHWFAQKYAQSFSDNGLTLEVKETVGSVENYRLLDAGSDGAARWRDPGVSVAIVQSGSCPDGIRADLRAVASLYLEPVWIFYRADAPWQLRDLRGKRVAAGPEGSGSRSILQRLLVANNIPVLEGAAASRPTSPAATQPTSASTTAPTDAGVILLREASAAAVEALRAGRADALVCVLPPRHPLIRDLLRDSSLRLMSFDRHEAYARIFPFMSDVKVPRGTVDLARDLPQEDVYLLAPAANLVCRADLHPSIVSLLIKAATKAHERGDLISPPGKLPSTQFVEFPVAPAAAEYFRAGPPFLQRYLPFWLAALVDRMKILLLPMVTLLIPLARLAPPLYVWRTRSRIYRWYRVLREIDRKLRADADANVGEDRDPQRFDSEIATLREMEIELGNEKVPLSYMEEYYNLRQHTDFLRRRAEEQAGIAARPAPTAGLA